MAKFRTLCDLRDGNHFIFEGEEYIFDRLMGHDSAWAFHIKSQQSNILSRHVVVEVVE